MLPLGAARAQRPARLAPHADQSRAEYERVAQEISLSTERLAELAAEIGDGQEGSCLDHGGADPVGEDRAEARPGHRGHFGAKLEGLKGDEQKIRASLAARRGVLAEVLGALQRMGLNPPPAILVKPEDALSSVRSAILLGAVVPELRQETEILLADLKELSRVAASIEAERARLTAAVGEQVGGKEAARHAARGKAEAARARRRPHWRRRAASPQQLAAKAGSLKELIASLEKAQAADSAEGPRAGASEGRAPKTRRGGEAEQRGALPVPEANRLTAAAPFSALRGRSRCRLPASIKRRFGASDGNGGSDAR